jgi:hypothetical protein
MHLQCGSHTIQAGYSAAEELILGIRGAGSRYLLVELGNTFAQISNATIFSTLHIVIDVLQIAVAAHFIMAIFVEMSLKSKWHALHDE